MSEEYAGFKAGEHTHTIQTNNVGHTHMGADGVIVPEKTFTQAEVEKIIGERLARDRKEVALELKEHKELLEELRDYGYEGSVQEVKSLIKSQKEELQKQQEVEQLQQEAQQTGTSPELMAEIKELKKQLADITAERQAKEKELKAKIEAEESWNKQFNEFKEAYPDVDETKLNENPKFLKFIKNKAGTLKELYEDFIELVGETEAEVMARSKSKDLRSTSSGKLTSSDTGATYGLTDNQKMLAKENGMTYKEYAEAMKTIKK